MRDGQAVRMNGGSGTSSTTISGRGCLGGRPRLRFWATIRPLCEQLAAPDAPGLLAGSRASARQASRTGHFEQIALARAMSMRSSEKKRNVSVPVAVVAAGLGPPLARPARPAAVSRAPGCR